MMIRLLSKNNSTVCKVLYIFIFTFLIVQKLFSIKTQVFKYKICPTENFEIYYCNKNVEPILPLVTELIETSFVNNTEFFDIKFDYKIPFFLFYGYEEFLQNTIVNVSEGTGGVTEAFKNRLLLPYTGSKKTLQHVINHEFIHEIEFNILYSGFWRTPRLAKSIFYPHWLLEGLAEYRARDFTKTEQEMVVRDMVLSNKLIPLEQLHNFGHLKPHMVLPAYEQSAKFMEFLAVEYGPKTLVDMLKLYRDRFDANSVVLSVYGLTLKQLEKKFIEEMETRYFYEIEVSSMTDLDIRKRITSDNIYLVHHYSPCIYKDQLIYLADHEGEVSFYTISLNSKHINKKPKRVIPKRIIKNNVDIIHKERISVSSKGTLCFSGLKNNRSYLFLYNLHTKQLKKYSFKEIDIISSVYISPDENFVAITGVKNSYGDVFLFDIKTQKITQITNDEHFESHVTVSKDGKMVAYYKELPCKKFSSETQTYFYTFQTDIFVFDLVNSKEIQITHTIADEYYPCFISNNKLVYTSDYNDDYLDNGYGVYNLFMCKMDDTTTPVLFKKLTNVIGGIYQPYVDEHNVVVCYYRNMGKHIYLFSLDDIPEMVKEEFDSFSAGEINTLDESKDSFYKVSKIKKIKDYKFTFSTDLFFPFFYYSSQEGLAALFYWQGSDMVAENKIGVYTLIMGEKNFSYDITYEHLRYRPLILFNFSGTRYYIDYINRILRDYLIFKLGIAYPLDKFSYITLLFGYPYLKYSFEIDNDIKVMKENIVYLNYTRNTLSGKYLEPIYGNYYELSGQFSEKIFDGDFSYQIFRFSFMKYINLGKEHAGVIKVNLVNSTGEDKVSFSIGGMNAVRGVPEGKIKSHAFGVFSLGYRLPLVYDINYYMWYLFPDLFLKGLYVEPFFDFGIDHTFNTVNSIGLSFKLYTFVLQTYVLKFNLTFAKQNVPDSSIVSYFTLSGGI